MPVWVAGGEGYGDAFAVGGDALICICGRFLVGLEFGVVDGFVCCIGLRCWCCEDGLRSGKGEEDGESLRGLHVDWGLCCGLGIAGVLLALYV